jgi:hypothetical protein
MVLSLHEIRIYERLSASSVNTCDTIAFGVGVFCQRAQACVGRVDYEQDSFLE